MHGFLAGNRDELIARCKAKVAKRPLRAATPLQLANGIPTFLGALAGQGGAIVEVNAAPGIHMHEHVGGRPIEVGDHPEDAVA